jgi:nucleoside-diphosphate-sugar epimerase
MGKLNVLVVGAGGFLGSYLTEECLKRGYNVWAGVRETTSRKWLQSPDIRFAVFNFDEPDTLADTIRSAVPNGKWDYIIYNLGATKCVNFADFNKINYEYLRSFINALKSADMVPQKMLFISSLSVFGPGDEKGFTPFTTDTPALPNTKYGASKLKAEMELTMSGIPYIILRATGIYGPKDKDYYLMLQSLQKGFDFSAGLRKQMLTFIYAADLAKAACDALEKAPAGNTYIVAEKQAYTQDEYRKLASEAMGCRHPIPIKAPLWCVKLVSVIAEKIGVARMKPSTLNRDKYNIMKQRNWRADVSKAEADFGFTAPTSLKEGLEKSVKWYRENGWLK